MKKKKHKKKIKDKKIINHQMNNNSKDYDSERKAVNTYTPKPVIVDKDDFPSKNFKQIFIAMALVLCAFGIALRFYKITLNQFVYYDEGMYLNHTKAFLYLVDLNPPSSFGEFIKFLTILLKLSLNSNKVLWFFLAGLRNVFFGSNSLFFTRLISAIFGSLTLWMVYLFSLKYFNSKFKAFLSAAILAILPSHVYYSRLGLQEGFSSFCFIVGMYFYLLPRKFSYKTILSGLFFSFVYFTNYRMIVIPIFILLCELLMSYCDKTRFNYKKIIVAMLTFVLLIIAIGLLYGGNNLRITFAWMFHQADLAQDHFSILNLLSYPYYLFKLESIFFGLLFFGNIYYFYRSKKRNILPFAVALLQMVMFSFPQEKGTRYICVVIPFMAIAVSTLIVDLYNSFNTNTFRRGIIIFVISMFIIHFVKANEILLFKSDYGPSIKYILENDKKGKVLSTQYSVQNLYAPVNKNFKYVEELPKNFNQILKYYSMGYRYIVIGPQAYISYTKDGKRFSKRLTYFLQYIINNFKPIKVYPHFNPTLLERFVLEHNEYLPRSIDFLRSNKTGELGQLRVYDLSEIIKVVGALISKRTDQGYIIKSQENNF